MLEPLLRIIGKIPGCKNIRKYNPYCKEADYFMQFHGRYSEDIELIDMKIRELSHYVEKNIVSVVPMISHLEERIKGLLDKRKAFSPENNATTEEAKRAIEKCRKLER